MPGIELIMVLLDLYSEIVQNFLGLLSDVIHSVGEIQYAAFILGLIFTVYGIWFLVGAVKMMFELCLLAVGIFFVAKTVTMILSNPTILRLLAMQCPDLETVLRNTGVMPDPLGASKPKPKTEAEQRADLWTAAIAMCEQAETTPTTFVSIPKTKGLETSDVRVDSIANVSQIKPIPASWTSANESFNCYSNEMVFYVSAAEKTFAQKLVTLCSKITTPVKKIE